MSITRAQDDHDGLDAVPETARPEDVYDSAVSSQVADPGNSVGDVSELPTDELLVEHEDESGAWVRLPQRG